MEKSHINTHYSKQDYITPSGKIVKYQGYENFLLNELYNKYLEDDVINNPKSIQYLDVNGCKHRYFPDCYTTDNILYEVKSEYTFEEGKKNNVLYNKIKYSLEHCEKYVLIIYEKDGSEIDRMVFTKNNIVSLNYLKVV